MSLIPPDKGWMKADSLSVKYLCGVHSFITFTKANLKSNEFSCPCDKYQNKRGQITSAQISHHLVSKDIDQSYTNWYFHGEPIENKDANLEIHGATRDHPHDVPRMLDLMDEAFGYAQPEDLPAYMDGDDFHENVDVDQQGVQDFSDPPDNEQKYLREDAIRPLYPGCEAEHTTLSATVELMRSESSTTTQNSGVTMKAITTFISRKSDPNGVEDETTYYGMVKEILELNYFDFQISKEEDEPFILAFQASQVFYCKDLTRNDYWHIVLNAPKKLTRDIDAYEDPLLFKGIAHKDSFDLALAGEVMDEEEESSEGDMAQIEGKKVISFDENAQPIGENGAKFVSNIGGSMRTYCPIFYEFWRFVSDHHKETIWKNVADEYDVPTYMKGKVFARAQRLWCDHNSKYRKFNYEPYPNDKVRKTKCPKSVRPEDWERFLELQREPRVIARRERGKAARKAMKRPHTSGRRGSGRAAERLRKKNPKVPIFRIDVYIATHTRADGSSLNQSLMLSCLDVDNDPVAQVCGKDTKARTRAYGLNVSREEVLSSYHLRNQLLQEKTARFTLEEDLVHVKDKLTTMDEKLSSLAAGRQGTFGSATFNATKSPSSMRPLSLITLLGKKSPCELLSFTGKIVASGRAIGDSHSAVYIIIIDDVTYNIDIDSVDSDPSLSSLNEVELGTTIVWAKMLTRFFNWIDMSSTSFIEPLPVIEFVCQLLNKDAFRPLSDVDRVKIMKTLRGMKVEVTHQENLKNIRRKYRVIGLTVQATRDLTFSADESGTIKSVVQHFQEAYDIVLQHPHWPCLQVGNQQRPNYLPMEVCKIVEGQRYSKSLSEKQVTSLLKVTCQRPYDRECDIVKTVHHNDYDEGPYAKEFGLKISNKLATIEARILPTPVSYNKGLLLEGYCYPCSFRLKKAIRKIHVRLTMELEKKFSGKDHEESCSYEDLHLLEEIRQFLPAIKATKVVL
ncbi:hypothetical protein GIB67_020813 [Kingdonia uniflora]|uniref:PAZ domain-containing protein n=1 Tax=Kingdonia uniflora TaxID=39325 RepID=A0A7J7M7E5_9MAGN|nr:hypothetical protein GIB67_020813 [Kingdonia uniflora]